MNKINEYIRKNIKQWYNNHGASPFKYSIANKGEIITGRALFFYHINNEVPQLPEYLYKNIYQNIREITDDYYKWSTDKFGNEFEISWINLKLFSYDLKNIRDEIDKIEKLMEKYNIYDEWMFDAIIINMFLWSECEYLAKENLLIYPDIIEYIFGVNFIKKIEKPNFYKGLGDILNNVLEIKNKEAEYVYYPPNLRPFNPNLESKGEYEEYVDKEINKYTKIILSDINEKGYEEAKNPNKIKKQPDYDSEYKWAVRHYIKKETYQKIYNEEIVPFQFQEDFNEEDYPNLVNIRKSSNDAAHTINFTTRKSKQKNKSSRFSEECSKELEKLWNKKSPRN